MSEPEAPPWYEPAPVSFLTRWPSYPWIVVGTVCVGAFMGQLDASIAQLVLPALEREFQASLAAVSWVAVAYLLTVAALLPVFGRLADIMGRKMLYSGGFLVFVAGSAICGFAPSLEVLIAARVLQGVGAVLMQANSVAIIVAAADGSPGRLWLVTLALAIFGLGLGLFTAPNNSAIMSSASVAETGEAGGVLNLTRSFGMSTGIATASAVLSWQLAMMTGHRADTLHAPRPDLIAAAHAVVAVFAGFALLAAAASLIRGHPAPAR